MILVQAILLALWSAYAVAMGASAGLNGFGKLVALSAFVAVPWLYLLPTIEARKRRHPDATSIMLLDVFLGWSLVGWVIALAWACRQPAAAPLATTKACPFCAETVLAAAVKCKHCGSDISGTAPST